MHQSARDPHLRDSANKLTANSERNISSNFGSFYLINKYQNKKPSALKLYNNSPHGRPTENTLTSVPIRARRCIDSQFCRKHSKLHFSLFNMEGWAYLKTPPPLNVFSYFWDTGFTHALLHSFRSAFEVLQHSA